MKFDDYLPVGVVDGSVEGLVDGNSDGDSDGAPDGSAVGDGVISLRTFVGPIVGDEVGVTLVVGTLVVGMLVVGLLVEVFPVGTLVGESRTDGVSDDAPDGPADGKRVYVFGSGFSWFCSSENKLYPCRPSSSESAIEVPLTDPVNAPPPKGSFVTLDSGRNTTGIRLCLSSSRSASDVVVCVLAVWTVVVCVDETGTAFLLVK
jgi:hypothetical protein